MEIYALDITDEAMEQRYDELTSWVSRDKRDRLARYHRRVDALRSLGEMCWHVGCSAAIWVCLIIACNLVPTHMVNRVYRVTKGCTTMCPMQGVGWYALWILRRSVLMWRL